MSRPIITLTTDFGQADGYVGTMKGVLLDICPEATLVDISHDIQPQAVQEAAYVLSTASPYFPKGTVHLVVVDPGVGSERLPVAVQTRQATYVAPDNGVLSLALRQDPAHLAVHLAEPSFWLPHISATFHGRDVFAPVAAHLARGTDPQDMGRLLTPKDLVTLPSLEPELQPGGKWLGQVLHIDRFGNLITNLRSPMADSARPGPSPHLLLTVAGHRLAAPSHTFSDVAAGDLVAYAGSSGYLEIAIREGNAADHLGLAVGDPIQVEEMP